MDKIRICIFLILFIFGFSLQAEPAFELGDNGPRIGGFFEFAGGLKFGNDNTKRDDYNLLEQRLQLETSIYPDSFFLLKEWRAAFNLRGDFVIDEYFSGKTDFELRELSLAVSPLSFMDVNIGRQVFTWGTGDYLFVNDLFPKDYISFYLGRDNEYLKKPSDGIRLSFYTKPFNFEVIAIPFFQPNTLFKGDRLSFYDSFRGGIACIDSDRHLKEPSRQPENTEIAARVYRYLGRYEAALYFFRGRYKSPQGYLDEMNRVLFYPRLDVYGSSIRGPVYGGIGSLEFAYYHSREDPKGNNRLIPNDKIKILTGLKKDFANDLTLGVQYFYEQRLDYDNYKQALLPADISRDKRRHLGTFRITKLFKSQTVTIDIFTFFSPTDEDLYIRPMVGYDVTDELKVTVGANLIWGKQDYTEFGQAEHNKNIYLRMRYSF